MHHRRSKRLPDAAVRYLAWLCLFLTLWPGFVIAADTPAPAAVPVVTNVAGAVAVRSASGTSRDILSSQIIHSGDTLVTGVDSLAVVSLADVGKVRLGPASTATALATSTSLSVRIASGSLCVEAQSPAITIEAGALVIAAGNDSAVFNLIRDSSATTIAVYQGQISTSLGGKNSTVVKAGEAVVSSHDGNPVHVPIQTVQPDFAPLKCPDEALIAQAVPSAEPSAPSSGGHGGGAGILGILLGLGAIAAAAGGHGGGGGSSTPPPPPPPGTLSVNPASLSFLVAGAPQSFSASETNYSGPINASSGNKSVATVVPASGTGPGPVTFAVTPTGSGSTSITVSDNHGQTQSVSVTVTPPGTLSVNPPSLTFIVGGAPQQFTASESSYIGPIFASSSDTTIANVAPASGTGPGPVPFTVTPVGAGTTSILVTDNHGGAPRSVSITVVGPLTANPSSLTFLGTTTAKTFNASDPFYTGTISATTSNSGVATVSPASLTGPGPVTFTVTPVAQGSATITVSDTLGGSTGVSVSVSTGGLTINPTSLTFTVGGPTQTFTASEANYKGLIHAASSNPSQVTVSPASGTGPGPIAFTVTALSAGNPTIAVTDDHGGPLFLDVTITGPLGATPSTLTFNGTTAPQTINVTDPNYFVSIIASSSDTTVATVNSPLAGPNASFSVTPVSRGSTTISFSDANGGRNNSVSVNVIAGPLNVSTSAVALTGPGATKTFTASETGYTGPISATSGNTAVATVSPASGGGPGPLTFTITATGPGATTVNVTDNHSGSQPLSVSVGGPLTVSTSSLKLTGTGATQPFTASEAQYTGTISASSNNTGVATVAPAAGTGPGPVTFTVTGVAAGTTTISVIDDHGGSQPISVSVGGPLTVSPSSFKLTGTGATQTFTASEAQYTGVINATSNNTGIATVAPASGTGPGPVTFTVTGVAAGTTTISVTDDHGGSQTVSVTVEGPLSVSASTLGINSIGGTQTFSASELFYSGSISAASSNTGVATVAPASGLGPGPVTFTVTSVAVGNANIVVTDDHGGSQTVQVSVTTGSIVVSPVTLLFAGVGSPSQTFTATDTGALTFTATSSDPTIANVTPLTQAGPAATFTVSTSTNTGKASITVTDVGGSAVVSVGVGVAPLIIKRHPISVHEPLPAPASTPSPSPPHRVLLPVLRPIGPLSPRNPDRVEGNIPPAPVAPVIAAPLSISTTNMTLLAGAAPQAIVVSEPGYSRFFTVSTSNPAVATVNASTGAGPTATFAIVPHDPGVALIRISDDHGGVRTITLTVREPERAAPLLPGKLRLP